MTAGNLRERLEERLIPDRASDALEVVRAWLSSDATVERVARALQPDNGGPPYVWETASDSIRQAYIDAARRGLAALAAALATEVGSDA